MDLAINKILILCGKGEEDTINNYDKRFFILVKTYSFVWGLTFKGFHVIGSFLRCHSMAQL